MHTDEQHDALVKLKDALIDAEAALPHNTDLKLLHGMAARLVRVNKANMTDAQYQTLGGGTDK
jgi:hypothetical protein